MRVLLLTCLLFCLSLQVNASGIEFFHGTWEEALEKAKAEEKIIFVDAYTTWCGPCKRMAKNVFTLPDVSDFYNENFINLKLDMEKKEGMAFQRKYPVSAFPTFYYIDEKGETVLTTKGGRDAKAFIELGQSAVGKVDRSLDFVEAYEKGDRDPELVYNYVRALNKAGKPSLKIANDYIKNQKDLTTPANLAFILEATTQADSRIFSLMIKHRSAIEKLTSKEVVKERIEKACSKTVDKAVEYESEDLLVEAKDKMKANYPDKAKVFGYKADIKFYDALGQTDKYLKACNDYAKKEINKDPEALHALVTKMSGSYAKNREVMADVEKIAGKAAKIGKQSNYYFTYARILITNGKKKDALSAIKKSKELAGNNSRDLRNAEMLQKQIENS